MRIVDREEMKTMIYVNIQRSMGAKFVHMNEGIQKVNLGDFNVVRWI